MTICVDDHDDDDDEVMENNYSCLCFIIVISRRMCFQQFTINEYIYQMSIK